jgi:poly-beta-1,6-N-acetyl-D-glucosamine synthase
MINDAGCLSESTGARPHLAEYVLITPARNEAEFIERTINSVVNQTLRPLKWVIVSDGSTDGTDEIVRRYAAEHDWIEFVRMPERQERHFAGKVEAFNAGYARLKNADYEIIGNLDADVSFEPDYIEYLLLKFVGNPRLGLAGTNRWEGALMYDFRFTSIEDVFGSCQLFRRQCYEDIGGYRPIKGGGVDLVALLSARMHGWETRSHTDRILIHHRPTGTATNGKWMVNFNDGRKDYMLGGHPIWELFRASYQMTKKPYGVRGCLLLWGYFWSMLNRIERPIPVDLIRFRRKEQMNRLARFLRKSLGRTQRPALKLQGHVNHQR